MQDNSWRFHVTQTARLAWPIILGNMSHILMALIDNVMIGRLGRVPLAATSFAGAIFGFCVITSVGMTSVISPLVAHSKGAGRDRECGEILWQALVLNVLIGLVICAVVYLAVWKIQFFSPPTEVIVPAQLFLSILAPSMILIVVFNTLRQFSEGLSHTRPLLLFLCGSLCLNAFFNWLLIYGHWGFPRWELAGAALGTVLSRLTVTAALIVYVLKSPHFKKYTVTWTGLKKSLIERHWSMGFPASMQYSSEAGAFTGAAILMGWIGTVDLAAHQIAMNLASMTFMIALGTSVATAVRVGEAHGQRDLAQARRAGFSAIILASGCMSVAGILFLLSRHVLPAFYISDPLVIERAASFILVAAVFQLFDGAQGVAVGALRGFMDVRWPTLITVTAYWGIALPVGYFLAFKENLGGFGIWLGLAGGLAVAATSLNWRFHRISSAGVSLPNRRPLPLRNH